MRREIFEKALKCFCPNAKIKNYNLWERRRLDENNNWIQDSPALFVSISIDDTKSYLVDNKLSEQLSDLLGHEIMIDIS